MGLLRHARALVCGSLLMLSWIAWPAERVGAQAALGQKRPLSYDAYDA
jgi:hypothetical protein